MQEERHCHCKEKCMYTHTSMHARTQIWLKSSCSGISLTFNFNLFHVCETPAVRCSHTYTRGLNATTLSLSIKPLFAEVSGQNLAWKASTNYSMCVSACKVHVWWVYIDLKWCPPLLFLLFPQAWHFYDTNASWPPVCRATRLERVRENI